MKRSLGVTIAIAMLVPLGIAGVPSLRAAEIPVRGSASSGPVRVVIDGRVVTVSAQLVVSMRPRANLANQAWVWVNLHTQDARGLPRSLVATAAEWRSGVARVRTALTPLSYILALDPTALPPPGFRYDPNDATYFGRARVPLGPAGASTVLKVRLWNGRRALDVRVPVEIMVYR